MNEIFCHDATMAMPRRNSCMSMNTINVEQDNMSSKATPSLRTRRTQSFAMLTTDISGAVATKSISVN
jgi:hypothetical protein